MYKLVISENLQREINFLHSKVGSKEWSGILAYSIEKGSLNDEDVTFIGHGIYPMDIGVSASTDFDYKNISSVYRYFNKKLPKKVSSKFLLGSIHTHHTMKAFISGTDRNEIITNSGVYGNYLFLVVDMSGDYVAKLGRKVLIEQVTKKVLDENGGYKILAKVNNAHEIDIVDVEVHTKIIVDKDFEELYNKIHKDKLKLSTTKLKLDTPNYYNNSWFNRDTWYSGRDVKTGYSNTQQLEIPGFSRENTKDYKYTNNFKTQLERKESSNSTILIFLNYLLDNDFDITDYVETLDPEEELKFNFDDVMSITSPKEISERVTYADVKAAINATNKSVLDDEVMESEDMVRLTVKFLRDNYRFENSTVEIEKLIGALENIINIMNFKK